METTYNNYTIKSFYKGGKCAKWGNNYNYHLVTIKNNKTGKRTSFDFWESNAKQEIETEEDLLQSFRCFISDAIEGKGSFEEFISNFGYSVDAYTTWKSCVNAYRKWERVSENDNIYDFCNSLDETIENRKGE